MNNNSMNNESAKFVANFNELGVKVEVSSLQNGSNATKEVKVEEPKNVVGVGVGIVSKIHGMTSSQRKDALAKAGVDVSKYFAMGVDMLVRMNADGEPEQVMDDDPIFKRISDEGYINVHKLFRRWVMAQMFNLMDGHNFWWRKPTNMTEAIRRKGYEYSWKTIINELHAQVKMKKNGDRENYELRRLWFDRIVCIKMCNHYIDMLRQYIDGLQTKHCSKYEYKQPYKTIHGTHYFISDLDAKIFRPLNGALNKLRKCCWSDVESEYNAMVEFNKHRISLKWETPQCEVWMQAFKGVGAYYTCDNLIKFHGCRVYIDGVKLDRKDSLDALAKANVQYSHTMTGWRMIGFLKKLMDDNHVDIEAKRAEWAKAKANRK